EELPYCFAIQRRRGVRLLAPTGWNLETIADLAVDLHHHRNGLVARQFGVEFRPRFQMDRFAMPQFAPELLTDERRHRRQQQNVRLDREAAEFLRREL